jgi:hypothetical protein
VRTVALLARAWLQQRLSHGPAPSVRPAKEPSPPAKAPPLATPPVPVAPLPPAPVAPPEPQRSDEEGLSDPPLTTGPPPVQETIAAPAPAAPPATALSWAIELLAEGYWAPGDLTGGATLAAELGVRDPFGVTLEGGWQSNRVARSEPGIIIAQMQHVSLGARYQLSLTERMGLSFALEACLALLEATTYHYLHDGHANVVTGGPAAAIEWRRGLTSGLFVSVRVEAQVRIRPEVFNVDGIGPVMTVPGWSLGAAIGLGFQSGMKL